MKNKNIQDSTKQVSFHQDNKNVKVLNRKPSIKSNGQIITNYPLKKKDNLNTNSNDNPKEYEIVVENAKNKINEILEDKSIPDYPIILFMIKQKCFFYLPELLESKVY